MKDTNRSDERQNSQRECVRRFQIASEFRQAVGRAEQEAYAYYDSLQGDDDWRVEQRVAFEQRCVQRAVETLRRRYNLTEDEFSDLLVEQSEVEAVELSARYPQAE
jgi:hypothetical protein